MVSKRHLPTSIELALRERFLRVLKECSLESFIDAEKVQVTKHGFVLGEFSVEETTNIINRLEAIGEICGAIIDAKLTDDPFGDSLKWPLPLPVDYIPARIINKKQTACS